MRINDLNLNEAPVCGVMLAYTRKNVLLEPYSNLEEVCSKLDQAELLEIHLFDANMEYRAVKSESRRWNSDQSVPKGIIQKTVKRSENDDVYAVEVLLDQKYKDKLSSGSIKILNHLIYDDNGAAMIDNYRLIEGGR